MEGINNAHFQGFNKNKPELICIHKYVIEEYDGNFFISKKYLVTPKRPQLNQKLKFSKNLY